MGLLTIDSVSKSFGKLEVLNNLSFAVEEGSVFGFIGRNGSGKTTTMKIIVGLLKADQGDVYINGTKVIFGQTPTNHLIGYLPDVPEFYGFMNAYEYLRFCGKITGMNTTEIDHKSTDLLTLVGLQDSAQRRIKGYSRGMKQRLGIAQALMHNPLLLICDEPTSALDPQGRSEILAILSQVRQRTTVLFSTHILADVERICDTVGVLHNGKLALGGNLEAIKSTHRRDTILFWLDEVDVRLLGLVAQDLQTLPFIERISVAGTVFSADVKSVREDGQKLLAALAARQLTILGYQVQEPSLENLYLDVIS
ncbi:MAG: ABC transporter ATP-binding protein [Eggerthellaceae bacterium]|jgi:ABC-2 type transport system ATP-binding protein|nr:ABC transporter ATP-binding protein [Eggerthellaceae bacterium]MDR2721902.1 ABC transporter ATP-binding protein [Coriobacteriaceae bacterium]